MKVYQFREQTDNFSYLIICEISGKAAIIDPGPGTADSITELGLAKLEIECIINTHRHSDHTSGNNKVMSKFPCKIISSAKEAPYIQGVTVPVGDKESIMLGSVKLEFLLTPGHTPGGMCILADGKALFTGDTLFIGDCGRTDLPGGSNAEMFRSMKRLRALPDGLAVYPGHDYGEKPSDTLGNQKRINKTLKAKTLSEFSSIQ